MEENEVAGLIEHFIASGDADVEPLSESGCSGFYCIIEGKRFKVRVTECGEDI